MVIPPAKPDKPNREFGFIHFAEKETVDKLIADAGQGRKPELDGKTLEVCRCSFSLAAWLNAVPERALCQKLDGNTLKFVFI